MIKPLRLTSQGDLPKEYLDQMDLLFGAHDSRARRVGIAAIKEVLLSQVCALP